MVATVIMGWIDQTRLTPSYWCVSAASDEHLLMCCAETNLGTVCNG